MENQTNQINAVAKPVPPAMRRVFAYVFLILSLFLALLAADKILTEGMIAISRAEAPARVVGKEAATSRTGRSYYLAYEFEAGKQRYQRKVLFGLIPKMTQVRLADFEALAEGANVNIIYSKANPAFNLPVNDPYKNDKLWFILLGVLIFGIISVNEFRSLGKMKDGIVAD
ncbi:MAG: hypothetical protein RDU76_01530 [Candidatus Edwardsbacteria bacterium]|nr:hypothetical protein [Candidatus Edwardsbacteria bacterium]